MYKSALPDEQGFALLLRRRIENKMDAPTAQEEELSISFVMRKAVPRVIPHNLYVTTHDLDHISGGIHGILCQSHKNAAKACEMSGSTEERKRLNRISAGH